MFNFNNAKRNRTIAGAIAIILVASMVIGVFASMMV